MKGIFLPFLFVCILISCTPERRIEMKNRSSNDAHVIFTLKADSAKTSPLFISNNTEVRFDLKNTHPHNLVKMSYGIGKWSTHIVNDLAMDLESIEIQSNEENIKLTDMSAIQNYLMQHRKGIGKTKMQFLFK